MAAEHGAEPVTYRTANDTLEDLPRARRGAPGRRPRLLAVPSAGERDLILDVLGARGEVIFHGIAVKSWQADRVRPGASGKLFFGMPGYPASCLTNAYILLAPVLRRMARLAPQVVRSVNLLAQRADHVGARAPSVLYGQDRAASVPASSRPATSMSMSQADGYIEMVGDRECRRQGNDRGGKAVLTDSQVKVAESIGILEARRHIFLCCDQTSPKCCEKERGWPPGRS